MGTRTIIMGRVGMTIIMGMRMRIEGMIDLEVCVHL
jgi:hypothetical protein